MHTAQEVKEEVAATQGAATKFASKKSKAAAKTGGAKYQWQIMLDLDIPPTKIERFRWANAIRNGNHSPGPAVSFPALHLPPPVNEVLPWHASACCRVSERHHTRGAELPYVLLRQPDAASTQAAAWHAAAWLRRLTAVQGRAALAALLSAQGHA
jgi:hypothetical protein